MTSDLGWETAGQTGLAEVWGPWGTAQSWDSGSAVESINLSDIFLRVHKLHVRGKEFPHSLLQCMTKCFVGWVQTSRVMISVDCALNPLSRETKCWFPAPQSRTSRDAMGPDFTSPGWAAMPALLLPCTETTPALNSPGALSLLFLILTPL